MTVERLAVAVLLCAGLDVTGTGAHMPARPLSVAVPPSETASGSSDRKPVAVAVEPARDPSGKPEPGPETPSETGDAPPPDEEYVPLDLPPEDGGASAGADPTGSDSAGADSSVSGTPEGDQVTEAEPVVLGLDKQPDAATFYVYAEIFGVPNADGVVSASLCTKKNFTKSGCRTERVAAREGQVSVTFDNVAPGSYAVQVHHDQNGNGKMDFSFFGLPKEPYGFSMDAKPVLAPPKFKAASFDVVDGDVSLVINLQNT